MNMQIAKLNGRLEESFEIVAEHADGHVERYNVTVVDFASRGGVRYYVALANDMGVVHLTINRVTLIGVWEKA